MMHLSSKIEAILFYLGESTTVGDLARMLTLSKEEIITGLAILREQLNERGITLLEHDGEIALRTASDAADLIRSIRKEELEKDLGKAGLETLAIILYQGPVTRAHVDYVRGVNSAFIVRQLMVRGLIERIDNPRDQRSFLYKPSLDLLSFLGLSSLQELPDKEKLQEALASFAKGMKEEDAPSHAPSDTTDPNDTSAVSPH